MGQVDIYHGYLTDYAQGGNFCQNISHSISFLSLLLTDSFTLSIISGM